MTTTASISNKLDHDDFKELLIWRIEETSDWRLGKSRQYSHDYRNKYAADHLNALKDTVQDIREGLLTLAIETCSIGEARNPSFHEVFHEKLSETLRDVGFGFNPRTANQIVEALLASLRVR